MPGFTEELLAIRSRMQQTYRTHAHEMLWEDPVRASQPFWDVAVPAAGSSSAGQSDDEPVRPLIVMSSKPYVEPRVHRSRTR